MKILITNDDGYQAEGILALAKALKEIADIVVVAPTGEKSGTSSSITIYNPLRYKAIKNDLGIDIFAVNGTPVDSVKLGLSKLIKGTIDLVVSGINNGPNIAMNTCYSGTVGAAMEGAIWGIPAIAVSIGSYTELDYETPAMFMKEYIKTLDLSIIDKGSLLNINVPNIPYKDIKGHKYTSISTHSYLNNYEERSDTFRDKYYWLSDYEKEGTHEDDSDVVALASGYVSISPMKASLIDDRLLLKLKNQN